MKTMVQEPKANQRTKKATKASLERFSAVGVQSLSHGQLSASPWITTCRASPSFTVSFLIFQLAQIHVH